MFLVINKQSRQKISDTLDTWSGSETAQIIKLKLFLATLCTAESMSHNNTSQFIRWLYFYLQSNFSEQFSDKCSKNKTIFHWIILEQMYHKMEILQESRSI